MSATVASTYNILKRYKKAPPSLSLHMFPTHFRFEQLNGVFMYESPMTAFIDDYIKVHRLPTELLEIFDLGKVPFYDGCLIVAMHDYRSPTATPGTPAAVPNVKAEMYRIVLFPTNDMLHADIMARNLEPDQALRLEAKLLQIITPPLCLDPSLECTRIANSMYRSSMILPTKDDDKKAEAALSPASAAKRSREGLSEEGRREEKERIKRQKLMHVMDEAWRRPFAPTFDRMGFVEQHRADRKAAISHPAPAAPTQAAVASQMQMTGQNRPLGAGNVKKPMSAPVRNMPTPPYSAQSQQQKKIAVPGPTGPVSKLKPPPKPISKKQREAQAIQAIPAMPVGQHAQALLQQRLPQPMAGAPRMPQTPDLAVGVGLQGFQQTAPQGWPQSGFGY